MRHFIVVLLLIHVVSLRAFSANLQYINGLYVNKNCDYFARELKDNWNVVPEDQRNDYLAKLADCSVERGQLEFAESLFRNLEKKNYNSSILSQAKAKADLSRSDFRKITDDYEGRKPLKATFQYYIYVAQSYYEQENYDAALKVLSYISPNKLTDYQKSIIRYWKAKNYFLKDEYDKADYYLDLILDEDEKTWVTDAAQVLKNALNTKYRPFRAVVYLNGTFDTNTNKESVSDQISNEEVPTSYIIDGTYRINPSMDFYLLKTKSTKKYINLDLSFAWSSKETSNESQTYTIKYRHSKKVDQRNTLSFDAGFSKAEAEFQESSNDAFVRFGIFHLITSDKFATASYRYGRNVRFLHKAAHSLSLSLFSLHGSQMIYGTLSRSQIFDQAASYEFDGSTAPYASGGTTFGNYGVTSLDLAHSYDFADVHTLRTQFSYSTTSYSDENLPAGSESLTNSTDRRNDQTYTLSLVYANKYSDDTNVELFATAIKGTSHGHQGYLSSGVFTNKNYTANQIGINIDWTYE